MSKKVNIIVFYILLVVFSICYWSFFPGAYTFDSYISYLNSLGFYQYLEVVSPIFAMYWKIGGNYNFAPLLINYLIFLTALFLSIRFTKEYYIGIFSIFGLCLPYTLITYICAWKDNALLSILFLIIILLLSKNKSILITVVTFILFFISFSLRLNAVFAVLPLLYYFLHIRIGSINKYRKLKTALLTFVIVLGFQVIKKGAYHFIFNAEVGNVEQTLMYTDIAKINYLQKRNVVDDIPEAFITTSSLDSENIDKMFEMYCKNSCNDMLYMFPEWQGVKAFLHMSNDEESLRKLKTNWLKKIITNPVSYLHIRASQLNNALWANNILYSSPQIEFNEEVFNRIAGGSEKTQGFDKQSKVFSPMTNDFAVSVRSFFGQRSMIIDLISFAGSYLILSIIMLVVFLMKRKINSYYKLGCYLSASGILYVIGYFPLLPCTDYRYFVWTIFSFWVSLGIFVLASYTGKTEQLSGLNYQSH